MSAVRSPRKPGTSLPTILLLGLGEAVRREAERIALDHGIARLELNDLRRTCTALKLDGPSILVASTATKPWDRTVVEEHAARACVELRWIEPEAWEALEGAVAPWLAALRPRPR